MPNLLQLRQLLSRARQTRPRRRRSALVDGRRRAIRNGSYSIFGSERRACAQTRRQGTTIGVLGKAGGVFAAAVLYLSNETASAATKRGGAAKATLTASTPLLRAG